MAADSSMGFHHQGITAAASVYNHHHMLSFQSSSDVVSMVGSGGAAGMGFATPRSMSGTSSTAGMYLSPNNNNNGGLGNASVVGPSSRSSSGDAFRGSTTASKYKFVTGSPSEWSDREQSILKEGLARYAREPNIMRYIKIAAMLPNRTIRDVALRCWWATGKDRRKKPDGFFTGKKIRDMKPMQDKMVASAPMANFHMAPTNNLTPFSISMQSPNQQCQVPKEAPILDSATQQLLEQNNQLLNQIAGNIETFKTEENTGLFLRTNNNIRTILTRMSETPGIMGQMPPLPAFVHEDKLNTLLQVDRIRSREEHDSIPGDAARRSVDTSELNHVARQRLFPAFPVNALLVPAARPTNSPSTTKTSHEGQHINRREEDEEANRQKRRGTAHNSTEGRETGSKPEARLCSDYALKL